jgi:hypothetical protein
MYPPGVMRRLTDAMSWALMITLVVGLIGVASSAVSMPRGLEGMQHCQWMTPAACCDQPLSVSGSNPLPKPAPTITLLAPLPSLNTVPWTLGHASISGQPFYQRTVVLRL